MNRLPTSHPTSSHHAQRGQGLVEFALIVPLLLAVFLGILDFGRLLFVYSEVSSAVREAIRYSAVNPYDCAGIRQRASSTLTLTDVNSIDLTIVYDNGETTYFTFDSACSEEPPELATGDRVTIRAYTTARLITGDLIGPIVRQTFPVFPIEYVSSRTVVPSEGVETGPTTTPRPTLPPPPGATNTPTPTQTPAPPSPPIDFIASVNCQNGNVGFSWQPVAGATDYRVYQAGAKTLVDDSTSTSVNNGDDLGASQQRSYYVVAVNAGGESAPSNISTVMCGAGATDTPTPTSTPTDTPTPTNTPTNTPTPTNTLTPSPSTTPRPTRTPAPSPTACPITVCTPTPTLTGSQTPTATSAPQLWVIFEPGYPSRKTTGPNKQFWVKVRVMDPQGNPISTAAVTLVEPASYSGWSLAHLGNGVYGGMSGTCFSGSTTTDVFVRVRATHISYSPAEVDANTSANPSSSACP